MLETDPAILTKANKQVNVPVVIEGYKVILKEGKILKAYLDKVNKRPIDTSLWDQYSTFQ